jgi:predicted DCC family thiol-disulfide oxidoreductase YuxK
VYQKVHFTHHPPDGGPLLVWDGACGFCHYWVLRWQGVTGDRVRYTPYQDIAEAFPDIPVERFREAAQLIEPDGRVFSGAAAAFRTLTYGSFWGFLFRWYESDEIFRWISDQVYQWVADNRSMLYRVTRLLWGKDPRQPRSYWVFYLTGLILILLWATRWKFLS